MASNNDYYYVLRGDNEELAASELRALIETYDSSGRVINCYSAVCVAKHESEVLDKIVSRAGFLKRAGTIVGVEDLHSPSLDYVDRIPELGVNWIKASAPRALHEASAIKRFLEALSSKSGLETKYRSGNFLEALFVDNVVIVGCPRAHRRKFSRERAFSRSIAIPPSISRALINLSRVREGEVLLDPFVGTGSIVIEANLMGILCIGVDIDFSLVRGALNNAKHYKLSKHVLIHGDSADLSYAGVDGIATDLPYGRGASTHEYSVEELYERFIDKALSSIKKRGYIAFVTSRELESYVDGLLCEYGLFMKKKHYAYVHGSLTRVIYEVQAI